IAASAPLRFCMAKRRAAARASKPSLLASWVPTSFQLIIGLLCHQRAKYVWSGVRTLGGAVAEPFAFTSLTSAAYAELSSGSGSTLRNCDRLWRRNGLTPPTHGVGSRIGLPLASRKGDQCPGLAFGTHCDGPNRPSS